MSIEGKDWNSVLGKAACDISISKAKNWIYSNKLAPNVSKSIAQNKLNSVINMLLWPGRATEIPEIDVYIVESMYDEARRSIKELPKEGLKKYTHSLAVTQDEIYFFRRLINPQKVFFESLWDIFFE